MTPADNWPPTDRFKGPGLFDDVRHITSFGQAGGWANMGAGAVDKHQWSGCCLKGRPNRLLPQFDGGRVLTEEQQPPPPLRETQTSGCTTEKRKRKAQQNSIVHVNRRQRQGHSTWMRELPQQPLGTACEIHDIEIFWYKNPSATPPPPPPLCIQKRQSPEVCPHRLPRRRSYAMACRGICHCSHIVPLQVANALRSIKQHPPRPPSPCPSPRPGDGSPIPSNPQARAAIANMQTKLRVSRALLSRRGDAHASPHASPRLYTASRQRLIHDTGGELKASSPRMATHGSFTRGILSVFSRDNSRDSAGSTRPQAYRRGSDAEMTVLSSGRYSTSSQCPHGTPFPPSLSCHRLIQTQQPSGRDALEGREVPPPPPPPPSRAPSLCPATVPLTASASFNGICNRQ